MKDLLEDLTKFLTTADLTKPAVYLINQWMSSCKINSIPIEGETMAMIIGIVEDAKRLPRELLMEI